jgi:flagellar basal-body rod protein FlgB
MINRLTESLDFHGQALVLRAERQRVIASNIANADTPGYKARDFDFAAALRSATSRSATSGNAMSGSPTAGSNIGRDIATDVMAGASVGGAATARLRYAVPGQTHLDNNTVDMDRERAAFMDNAVRFESTLRFVNGSVRTILDAMKSPNQG